MLTLVAVPLAVDPVTGSATVKAAAAGGGGGVASGEGGADEDGAGDIDQGGPTAESLDSALAAVGQAANRFWAFVTGTEVAPSSRLFVVYFDFNSDRLSSSAFTVLDEAKLALRQRPGARVLISGNADRMGPASYNQLLADLRARAVAKALAESSVKTTDVAVRAFGETRPVIKTNDGVGERMNRRVEILIED